MEGKTTGRTRGLAGTAVPTALLLIALLMMPRLALATPTSAYDVDDSQVTITGLLDGDTVSAYLIADADLDASNNLTYTFASGLPSAYDSVEELVAIASDGNAFTQNSAMQDAAGAIAAVLTGGSAAATARANDSGSATLTLGSGYYLVRVTSTSGTTRVYQNMVVDVSPQASAASPGQYEPASPQTLAVKVTEVTVAKTVGENYTESTDSYSVGDRVPFKIETAIPNYPADSANATFTITDTPSAGLEIDMDSIRINGAVPQTGAAYTFTATAGGIAIAYDKDYILAHPGEAVEVTYVATLTSEAFSHDEADVTGNTAKVEFNPNPYSDGTVEPGDTTKVRTYGYVFKKIDANGAALPGAVFTITLANGTTLNSTSDASGYVWFEDLAAGTYTATETTVPAGHLKAPDQTFTLSEAVCTGDNPATSVVENNYLIASGDVVDPDQPALPVTGGAGTFLVTVVGVALVGGSLVMFLRIRRKNREAEAEGGER